MRRPSTAVAPGRWEFDPRGFAGRIIEAREANGWSTRQLARRAGISQSYVVALERARASQRAGPTPTIDVVARLAGALGLEPGQLFAAGLRRSSRHVLLVVDDDRASAHARVRAAADGPVDHWVWVGSAAGRPAPSGFDAAMELTRPSLRVYDPRLVTASLADEFARLESLVGATSVGLVFGETAAVMTNLSDPSVLVGFEHRWASVVDNAAATVGAHVAWNVCVHDVEVLRRLDDPLGVATDLLRSHDTWWAANGRATVVGEVAARRLLEGVRPAGRSRVGWRRTVDGVIEELAAVA